MIVFYVLKLTKTRRCQRQQKLVFLICIVREDLTVDILIVSFYAIPSCHTGGAIYKCAVKISAQHNVFVIGSF